MAKRKLDISGNKLFEKHFIPFMQNGLRVWQAFNDFLYLAIYTFANNNPAGRYDGKYKDREEQYLQIIERYKRDDLYKQFPKMLVDLVELMENKEEHHIGDYLWHFYESNITYGEHGQFFTPWHITKMMVDMEQDRENKKTVCDPACGSGRFLLSACRKNRNIEVYGCDLDERCVLMATINLFLNGARWYTIHMNTLSYEIYGWRKFGLRWWCVPNLCQLSKKEAEAIMLPRKEQIQKDTPKSWEYVQQVTPKMGVTSKQQPLFAIS